MTELFRRPSRRTLLKGAAGMAGFAMSPALFAGARAATGDLATIHERAAAAAKELLGDRSLTLKILQPSGSLGNVQPVAERFTEATGIKFEYIEVPLSEITQKVLLEAVSKSGSFDLALPATFGLPDLAESGILVNLDDYARKYEPEDFQADALYTIGDYYKGSLYGYQTDGDIYLMFYNKPWLENAEESAGFEAKNGYALKIPETWEELDAMMAWFHRPDQGMYGGALFRTQYFAAWEWWGRFHAKGFYPFSDDLEPQINNEAGVAALEELIAASAHQYPGARTNGLFENFEAFGEGDKFADIGWGGTQKYLHSGKSKLKDKLAFGDMPGGIVDGELLRTSYFNWGWNYVVNTMSADPEIAYLYSLFACSPAMSTIATRDPAGYFDPTRNAHYKDASIIETYSAPFLAAHERAMTEAIPDLYLKGQGEYFDELRVAVAGADAGSKTAKKALDDCANAWSRITRRMGRRSQEVQWRFLKSSYPASIRDRLK
ncbi:extracellular solute-binding protein [Pikeienuella sp. HZG-20]|uniref:extracellular solute-binding protein n=1 Tax=Paludibacillus litoralis TaxID=3133267 RepID=UPI0030EB84BB